MSESISFSKPSNFSSLHMKYSSSKKSSSMKRSSSKKSYFSIATVKPSFFCRSLEAFSKPSIYRKPTMKLNSEVVDLSQVNTCLDNHEPGLQNWERWLGIHKQQQRGLSEKLKRPPQCMVMNTSFSSLPTNQEKNIIAESLNFFHIDKYRGHPHFWKSDDIMENDQKPSARVYQRIEDKYDRSRQNYNPKPKEFEHVGIPDEILKEMGLSDEPCLPPPINKWEKSAYVKERKEKLKPILIKVVEHIPELNKVVVVGKSIKKSEIELKIDSSKNYLSLKSVFSTDFVPSAKPSFSMSVTIENKTIDKQLRVWTVTFDNCFVNEIYKKSISIYNCEKTSSLKYVWSIVLPQWEGNDLPLRHVRNKSKYFYFNKSSGAILPENENDMVFYFKSSAAGVYFEKWEIQFNNSPDQWESVTLELHAVVAEKLDCMDNLKAIDSYLNTCTKYSLARKMVDSIIDRQRPERFEELPYSWKFFEEQIFLYNNSDYFYDSKCVSTLKGLFKKVSEGPWDFSVKNLRDRLVEKSLAKDSSEDLELFTSTVYQLMKPSTQTVLVNEKHKTVYELLCCFINRMESESINLKIIFNIPLKSKMLEKVEEDNIVYPKNSFLSEKPNARASLFSSKSCKKVPSKIRAPTMSLVSEHKISNIDQLNQKSVDSLSSRNTLINGAKEIERRQEYLETLYIKTYCFLCQTMDHISAVMESFENHTAKNILRALKK